MKTFKEMFEQTSFKDIKDIKKIKDDIIKAVKKSGDIMIMTTDGKHYSLTKDMIDDMDGDSLFALTKDGSEKEILLKNIQSINEAITWNHAEVAAQDCFSDLKSDGWDVKMSSSNGIKIKHDNGCVGTLVFDPQNKF